MAAGNFLEHQEVHGNFYGTHRRQVEDAAKTGKICILDIDVKGALEIANSGKMTQFHYLFISTPSIDELKRRLMARGTETEESLSKRIKNAELEVKMASEHPKIFTKTLINDEQERFVAEAE